MFLRFLRENIGCGSTQSATGVVGGASLGKLRRDPHLHVCTPNKKNRVTGSESHLLMSDKAVSRRGLNCYPYCPYTEFDQHLGVEFTGLLLRLHSTYSSTTKIDRTWTHTKCWPIHFIREMTINLGVTDKHWMFVEKFMIICHQWTLWFRWALYTFVRYTRRSLWPNSIGFLCTSKEIMSTGAFFAPQFHPKIHAIGRNFHMPNTPPFGTGHEACEQMSSKSCELIRR